MENFVHSGTLACYCSVVWKWNANFTAARAVRPPSKSVAAILNEDILSAFIFRVWMVAKIIGMINVLILSPGGTRSASNLYSCCSSVRDGQRARAVCIRTASNLSSHCSSVSEYAFFFFFLVLEVLVAQTVDGRWSTTPINLLRKITRLIHCDSNI